MNVRSSTPPGSLERALCIAAAAHAGAVDKAGSPYILHPLRVMQAVDGDIARIVALLHDVVEDSPAWSFEALRAEGFGYEAIEALESVTKRPEEEGGATTEETERRYLSFVARSATHPIGRRVKLADLDDNLDVRRLPVVTDKDRLRMSRYLAARRLLTGKA